MISILIAAGVGFMLGAAFGFFLTALLIANRRDD